MSTRRFIWPAILLIILVCTSATAQSSSPLLDTIVQSVHENNSRWHFIPGFCHCPVLVRSQTHYAFGALYYRKLTSDRRVSIYISYVPRAAIATDWMNELRGRNATAGWPRAQYSFADEAYLWSFDRGGAALYFRTGALIAELRGARKDVQFVADTLNKKWAR